MRYRNAKMVNIIKINDFTVQVLGLNTINMIDLYKIFETLTINLYKNITKNLIKFIVQGIYF